MWLWYCARRIESEIQYNSRKKRSCLRKPNYQLNNTCYCGIYSHVHSPSHTAHLIIFSCLLFISLSPAPSLHLSLALSLLTAVSIAISVSTDLFCCSFISFIYSFHTDGWRWFFWWSFVCALQKKTEFEGKNINETIRIAAYVHGTIDINVVTVWQCLTSTLTIYRSLHSICTYVTL